MSKSGEIRLMNRTVTGTVLAVALTVAIRADADPVVTCPVAKGPGAAKFAACLLKADASLAKTGDTTEYGEAVAKCNAKLADVYSKIETKEDGQCFDSYPTSDVPQAILSDCMACLEKQLTGAGGDCFCSIRKCPLDGAFVATQCWYAGTANQSCDQACTARGLSYDDATLTYAGSAGDDGNAHCADVMEGLTGIPGSAQDSASCSAGYGCMLDGNQDPAVRTRCTAPATTASAAGTNIYRACACR